MQYTITDDTKELFAALCKAQASMGAAVKDSKNPHFRSSYASLTAVLDAVVPVLNAQGITVLQLPHLQDTHVQLTTVLGHTSGQMLTSTVASPMGRKQDAQAVGSCITYLRRYALQSIMGLPVEDDDGNAASRRAPQQQRRQVPETSIPSSAERAFASVSFKAGKDHTQAIVMLLEVEGLTVADFNTWAGKNRRPHLSDMTPDQKARCYDWLESGNGVQAISAALTEPA